MCPTQQNIKMVSVSMNTLFQSEVQGYDTGIVKGEF